MPQSITDILGANATASNTTVTIDLSDFQDSNGSQMLDDPTTATDSQKIATLIAGIHQNSKPEIDANGLEVADKTKVIVANESFNPKTFEVRQDETQIKHEFAFSLYTVDSTGFDPNNAI